MGADDAHADSRCEVVERHLLFGRRDYPSGPVERGFERHPVPKPGRTPVFGKKFGVDADDRFDWQEDEVDQLARSAMVRRYRAEEARPASIARP